MRFDVITHRRYRDPASSLAAPAEWLFPQLSCADALPSRRFVPSLVIRRDRAPIFVAAHIVIS